MYASSIGVVPAPVGEVFEYAADLGRLASWHGLISTADGTGRLDHAGAEITMEVLIGGRWSLERWAVAGRVRWTLDLTAVDDGARRMRLSFSPWNGGCAVELAFRDESRQVLPGTRRLVEARTRRRLGRSITDLSRLLQSDEPSSLSVPLDGRSPEARRAPVALSR